MNNDMKCPKCGSRKVTSKTNFYIFGQFGQIETIICDKCNYVGDITDFYKPKFTIIAQKI